MDISKLRKRTYSCSLPIAKTRRALELPVRFPRIAQFSEHHNRVETW